MFQKLKDKLKKWLLQDELNRLQYVEKNIEHITNMADYAKYQFCRAEGLHKESSRVCEQLRDVCMPLFDVGMDIGFGQDHSWAVICVKGRPEYVKFMPLDSKDTRQIIDFLRHYERSNRVIDSPIAYRGMLESGMFI